MIDLSKLDALTKAATPEWKRSRAFGQLNVQDDKYMLSDEDAKYAEATCPAVMQEIIALIRKQEAELVAARAESANSGTFPDAEATVDTPEFRRVLGAYACTGGTAEYDELITRIDVHVAQTVARAVEEAVLPINEELVRLLEISDAKAQRIERLEMGVTTQASAPATQQGDVAKASNFMPTYGPDNPPRLSKQGESVEDYRVEMGWDKPATPDEGARQPAPVTDAAAHGDGIVPQEWMSEPCGPSVDDLSYGYGFRRGFNHCREEVLDRIAASQSARADTPDGAWPKDFRDVIKNAEDVAHQQGRAAGIEEVAQMAVEFGIHAMTPANIRAINKTGGA